MANLFSELKRRRVFRAALVYTLVGAAVIQVASESIPALGIPEWATSLVVLLVLLGFPIALVLAWAYDLTPEGVVRTADESGSGPPPVESPRHRWTRWSLPVAAGIAVSAYALWPPSYGGPEPPGANVMRYLDSLAVIPLDNATGFDVYEMMGLGIADQLITEFSRIRQLKVISRHSVQALANSGLTTKALADSLGVRYIIQGSMMVTDDQVRATVQQVDALTDAVVWSDNFAGPADDPVDAQNRIAREVAERVLSQMPSLTPPSWEAGSESGDAQLAYQLGSQWLNRRTPEAMMRAIESFQEAIALEATYARAHAELSSVYALALTYRYDLGLDSYTMARRALDLADRAVRLDADRAEGYAARGYIRALINAPIALVTADFERASELQPSSAQVASWRGRALELQGELEDALAETERAAQLDPLSAARQIAVAYLSLRLGRYDQAVAFAREGTRLEPELMLARAVEGRALLLRGDAEDCAAMSLGPHAALLATCLWQLGDTARAQALVDSVTAVVLGGGGSDAFTHALRLEDLAVFHAWRGDVEAATRLVAMAYDASPTAVDVRIYRSALFDRVRTEAFERTVDDVRQGLYPRVLRTSAD
jgi:TolB-like protein